ncbi:TonB-dependent receptor [Pedobacter metabolipauper]|uniref:TonB-dependent receptor n=1 Tax=Pedobacter metabolipauper TaxID=425513 RepID=UPI001414DA09|nr:TonB-dependent receptor [Pedobacter metabolipauper]
MKKICAFTLLFICTGVFQLLAQHNRKVSGSVTDTAKTAIPNVKVMIIADQDTLGTETDDDGNFSISKISAAKFSVKVSILGYQDFTAGYTFTEKEKHKRLGNIIIKMSSNMLKEVVISAKPNPIRFMQDTIEYNAAAFQVNEGDNVADLIKQFPGIEVDEDYNVKTMGKEMVKLRINGKDFFTNNVKDFIGKLPAGMVSKIHVIDDFGDEANFTGLKIGEPRKMLNIVTKPGMSRGVFGNLSANAGTNEMIGSRSQMNLWKDNKQSSANVNVSTLNNGAGINKSTGIGLSHNDNLGKGTQGGFSYNFSNNSSAFIREQVSESLNPEGNFINNSKSEGDNGASRHALNWNINHSNNKVFLQGSVNSSYSRSDNQNMSLSNQSGLIRQDLQNSNRSTGSSPNLSTSLSFSKRLKNKKNGFSANTSISLSGSNSDQNIRTNTLYYDKNTGALLKDSLLNRDLNSNSDRQNFNFGFNYSIGLKRPKDTLARKSLNFSYSGSASRSISKVSTFVFDNTNSEVSFVDSLSTSFSNLSLNQSIGSNYNYNSNKTRYNFGFNASPNILTNRDLRLFKTTKNNTFNYSPSMNFSRTLKSGKTLSINYQGSNINPTINQLQPVRNTQNLQNIVVGNPDLKASFRHNMNANFNYAHIKSGRSLQAGINASATQREIVDHVLLLPDTLNSLKQITRYENVNGNYQLSGNYNLYIPIKKSKYSIGYSGSLGFSNRAIIFNNQKAFGKGFNFSQQLNGTISLKKISLNTIASYSITNNNNMSSMRFSEYQPIGIGQISAPTFFRTTNFSTSMSGSLRLKKLTLVTSLSYNTNHNNTTAEESIRDISTINMSLSGHLTIMKSCLVNLSAAKSNNYGYALANSNPLLINASLSKSFLKNKSLSLAISGNDLLGQGNNISRIVAGNTIIDSRDRQQTRVISMSLGYNLSRFGGRNFRVDAD